MAIEQEQPTFGGGARAVREAEGVAAVGLGGAHRGVHDRGEHDGDADVGYGHLHPVRLPLGGAAPEGVVGAVAAEQADAVPRVRHGRVVAPGSAEDGRPREVVHVQSEHGGLEQAQRHPHRAPRKGENNLMSFV